MGKRSSQLIVPAPLRITMYICWRVCSPARPVAELTSCLHAAPDGGLTFGIPKRINDDPVNQNKWHWLGTLSVAPNGRIDSVWLDTRSAANNTDSQLFYSYSTDGGVTWAPNVR